MKDLISEVAYYLARNMIMKPKNNEIYKYFIGKNGLEIGGASGIFKKEGALPIYGHMNQLDNCDFSSHTVWRNDISEKIYKSGKGKVGKQYIADAVDLSMIKNETYDFLICSNVIEHIANPIKALLEWKRVVKRGGIIMVVAPNKESNFDHYRKVTEFEHLKEDYKQMVKEDDLTHMNEIVEKHDYSMDIGAHTKEFFYRRSMENFHNRTLHHHIFNKELLKSIFIFSEIKPILVQNLYTDFFILGQKK